MQHLQCQAKGPKNAEKCATCREHHLTDDCGQPSSQESKNDDGLCSLNNARNHSQPSTSSTMSQNSTPIFVYQRRRKHKNHVSFLTTQQSTDTKPSDGSHSAISSEAPSATGQEHMIPVSRHATEAVRSPFMQPVECNTMGTASFNCRPAGEDDASWDALVTDVDRLINAHSVNDNCSSSKSNLELSSASLRIDMDNAGECSSSGALIAEKGPEKLSEREICISLLKSLGVLDRVGSREDCVSTDSTGVRSENYCLMSCKICSRMGSTSSMLVCDNCEDAFHASCCTPNRIPVGEWLCSSCLKKKHKISKEKSACISVSGSGIDRNRHSEPEGELGYLEFMFTETEPYMSNARIGDEFQANVPDWCGRVDDDCNLDGEPLKIDPPTNGNMQESDSANHLKLSSIGNWLQCQEVIKGIEEGDPGTICGKWRRAPLFEVQTDEWECFDCVLWDPAHADCAVPQELATEEVMKQLKYIEMLRPRLAAKRRKLDSSKSNGSEGQSRSRDR